MFNVLANHWLSAPQPGASPLLPSKLFLPITNVEEPDYNWFANEMFQFGGANVSRLPEDHHELLAMVAPRALFATGNPDGLSSCPIHRAMFPARQWSGSMNRLASATGLAGT